MTEFHSYIDIDQKIEAEAPNNTAFSGSTISFIGECCDLVWTSTDESVLRRSLIIKNPNICQGQPTISGTRISVSNIIELRHTLGWEDIEKIKNEYPFLNDQQINAALEYYFANKDEIDNFIRQEKEIDRG